MYIPQVAEMNRASAARASRVAEIAIDSASKLARLNVDAIRAAYSQGVDRAPAFAGAKNAEELYALRSDLAASEYQSVVDYSRKVYELSNEVRAAYTQVADEAIAGFAKGFSAWVEKTTASAPQGSEAAVNAFKSSVAMASAAFGRFQDTSKQLASLADAGVRVIADGTVVPDGSVAPVPPKGKARKAG